VLLCVPAFVTARVEEQARARERADQLKLSANRALEQCGVTLVRAERSDDFREA
jgi:hypothetical protein